MKLPRLAFGAAAGASHTLFVLPAAKGLPAELPERKRWEAVAGLDKPSVAYLAKALAHHGTQPGRMVVVAHYEALAGAPWDQVVDLPGRDAAALPR